MEVVSGWVSEDIVIKQFTLTGLVASGSATRVGALEDRSDTWSVDAMPSDDEHDPVAEVRAHEDLMDDLNNMNLMGKYSWIPRQVSIWNTQISRRRRLRRRQSCRPTLLTVWTMMS
jgi:hypothetical protein